MNKNNEYPMSFTDVLNDIFKTKGWYQGEHFGNGVFITPIDNEIRVMSFSDQWLGMKNIDNLHVTFGVTHMKYRKVNTQPDVMRKV